jgi:neutral ceramidase
MLAGWARTPVTPPIGTALSGYYVAEGRRTGARAILDDLYAKALVIEHDGTRCALITSDLIAIPAWLTATVRSAVAARVGIAAEHLVVSASHNHSGPVLSPLARPDLLAGGVDEAYVDVLGRMLTGIITAAVADMRPARVAAGTGTCAINVNRRQRRPDGSWYGLPFLGQNPDGPVDRTVTVVRFDRDDGRRALLVNYPCHAVVLGANHEISGDYPGATQRFVEQVLGPGTLAMFTNGAEGNVNPIVHPGPISEAERLGRILGAEVVKVADSLVPGSVERVALGRRMLALPVATTPPLEDEERALAAWEARCRRQRAQAEPERVLDDEMSWTTALLRHLRRKRLGRQAEVEIQSVVINDTILLTIPGELFTELGQEAQAASPFAHTILVGLANDSVGYIPPRPCFEEGGFEVEASPFEAGAGEIFRDALVAQARAMA